MPLTVSDRARRIVEQLGGSWHGSYAMCRCPAHDDRTPSLSVKIGDKAVLFHCFAGCENTEVIAALQGKSIALASSAERGSIKAATNYTRLAKLVWAKAKPLPGTLAEAYLRSRAIETDGLDARFIPRAPVGPKNARSYHPALVVPIRSAHGIVSVQRTFLSFDPVGKADIPEPKRCLGNIGGGAVRKGGIAADGILHLAEGYEDACSISQLYGHICWSVCGIERYALISVPDKVRHVMIYSQHGSEAARAIAKARSHLTSDGRGLDIKLPPSGGDWNDLLRSQAGLV